MKDLYTLLTTENEETFEEQAKNFAGVETMRKVIWKCVCDEPDCFRICVQKYSQCFPTPGHFEEWLSLIVGAQTMEDMTDVTLGFCKKHNIHPGQLMREYPEEVDTIH